MGPLVWGTPVRQGGSRWDTGADGGCPHRGQAGGLHMGHGLGWGVPRRGMGRGLPMGQGRWVGVSPWAGEVGEGGLHQGHHSRGGVAASQP